ncbi:MAG: dTMP kinase [Gammaproteobacteria bacterium]|nr:dTMP kinase [Gammaproteobacteria bacterium]
MTTAGRFITFEGSEGVGKSTQIASVQRFIESAGIPLVVTREPGGTDLSEAVRGLLLDPDREPMHEDTELLLMFAARAEHLRAKIEPALRAGQWVLCDRFTDATFAYQGGGRGISADRIETLEQWVHAATQPDLTLLLDVPVEVGLARVRARAPSDRFEREAEPFFERVRQTYLARAHSLPNRFAIVDAQPAVDVVAARIEQVLVERFPELNSQ